ncbi:MAG: DUF4493 domain-containing protein [Bacteroidales bacterium]|nr:DUF4493 domain-containing protein [Bacteroidales bacterium]
MMLSIMALSSCNGVAVEELMKGQVNLSLSSTTEIEVKSNQYSEFDDYSFMFRGVDGYGSSDYYRYGDVVMPMDWYFGIYNLCAESCTKDDAEVGYGKLRYYGESSAFAVINDQLSDVSVICRVANCRVNVKFDDSMYEAFDGFKLVVRTVAAPDEEETSDDSDPETIRSLEFDPVNQIGYYNLQDLPINMMYALYVKNYGATEYVESISGYFKEDDTNAVINPADAITFNVKYTGDPIISPDIKFIVNGERTSVENKIVIGDYTQGKIEEEK